MICGGVMPPRGPSDNEIAIANKHKAEAEASENDGVAFDRWEVTSVETQVVAGTKYVFSLVVGEQMTATMNIFRDLNERTEFMRCVVFRSNKSEKKLAELKSRAYVACEPNPDYVLKFSQPDNKVPEKKRMWNFCGEVMSPGGPSDNEIAIANKHRAEAEAIDNGGVVFDRWEVTSVKTQVVGGTIYIFDLIVGDQMTATMNVFKDFSGDTEYLRCIVDAPKNVVSADE